jgi:hypothetical protein
MRKTDEEKAAIKIIDLISRIDLNLEDVGKYLARMEPTYHSKRFYVVAGACEEEVERMAGRQFDTLF